MSTYIPPICTESFYAILDCTKNEIDNYNDLTSSEEAFRIFTTLTDVTLRLFHNFKVTISQTFRNFSRSEMRAWIESHSSAYAQMVKYETLDFSGVIVNIPDGLIVPYDAITNLLITMGDAAQFDKVMTATANYLKLYERRDPADYASLSKETAYALNEITKVTKPDVENKLRHAFVEKHGNYKVTADKVFKNMATLESIITGVLAFETYYKGAAVYQKSLEIIDKDFSNIVSNIERAKVADRDYLTIMHQFVYMLAVQFDMYGAVLHEMQRVEHNVVNSVDMIRNHIARL